MDTTDIEQLRSNVMTNVANMPGLLMNRNYNFPDYESDERHLKNLEEVIGQLEQVFAMDKDVVQQVLGGEYKLDDFANQYNLEIPLFMYIDIMIVAIEKNMNTTERLNDRKKELIDKLYRLRELASMLEYDELFDASKHFSDDAKKNISDSHGNYAFKITKINDKRYLAFDSTTTQESFDQRHGDYYNIQTSTHGHDGLLYSEDKNELRDIEYNKRKKVVDEVVEHISKYFKNGELPASPDNLFKYIDSSYDFDFRYALKQIYIAVKSYDFTDVEIKAAFDRFLAVEKKYLEMEEAKKDVPEQTDIQEDEISISEKPKKKGLFSRIRDYLSSDSSTQTPSNDIDNFEEERKKQISDDMEIRDAVVFQRKMVEGKEVLVPLDESEYRVVKR